jgi:hypothetical protein
MFYTEHAPETAVEQQPDKSIHALSNSSAKLFMKSRVADENR